MLSRISLIALFSVLALTGSAHAQPAKLQRIGVIMPGGAQYETLEGLRHGLKELGLEEGKQIALAIRDVKGDAGAVEEAAKLFERENVHLILALTTPVITNAKAATAKVPIVFCIGSDPVTGGLVDSFAKPGGRLTGVHYLVRDLTAKRLEILKEILPRISRVLTFYDPTNRVASEGANMAQNEAKRLGIKLIERHVGSIEELEKRLEALKVGEADAFFFTPDPMVASQSRLVIEKTKAKKLPAMFQEHTLVAAGALASYGQNYREIGRLSAKYVQKILAGAKPTDLRIETVDNVELAINLRTAKELGLSIPPAMLARAGKVIR